MRTETKAFIVGGILIILAWFLYINYTYSMPEHGSRCIEEMQKCKESTNSVYTYFGGM